MQSWERLPGGRIQFDPWRGRLGLLRSSLLFLVAAVATFLVAVFTVGGHIRDPLLDGAEVTLQVTGWGVLIGTAAALLSGLASLSPLPPLRWISRVYVEFFRGTSAIVQLYWFFFAVPLFGPSFSPMEAGALVLGLNMGSYGSEVVRAGIRAVDRGQTEASVALGLSSYDRMRHVILPQAVVTMLPPYGNLVIELLKGTALVSLITLSDITWEGQTLRSNGEDSTTVFNGVLLLYFAIALAITAVIRFAERFYGRGIVARARG